MYFFGSSVWKGDDNLKKLQVTYLRLHELAAAVLINQNTKCTTLNIELSLDSFSRKGMISWNCCRSHIWDHPSWRLLCRLNLNESYNDLFKIWILKYFGVFAPNWLCINLPYLNRWTHKWYLFRLQGTDMFSKHCFFFGNLVVFKAQSCHLRKPKDFDKKNGSNN